MAPACKHPDADLFRAIARRLLFNAPPAAPEAPGPNFSLTELFMDLLAEAIAADKQAFLDAVERSNKTVTDLNATIAKLQAQADQNGASPEHLAALDELRAIANSLNPSNPAVLPEGVAPAVPPAPGTDAPATDASPASPASTSEATPPDATGSPAA